jgi:hypothetical protein
MRRTMVIVGVVLAALVGGMGVLQPEEDKPTPPAKTEDVQTIDAIIAAFYEVTAGEPGQARDWDRMRSLFIKQARMIPVRHTPHATGPELILIPVDGYIELNKPYFEKGGFFEKEAARRVEQFGDMAHVWSTYESRRRLEEPEPYVRGIYSIQLAFDGTRWWIVNVMWDHEKPDRMMPEKYLKSPE